MTCMMERRLIRRELPYSLSCLAEYKPRIVVPLLREVFLAQLTLVPPLPGGEMPPLSGALGALSYELSLLSCNYSLSLPPLCLKLQFQWYTGGSNL
jgi:hypothetical protein